MFSRFRPRAAGLGRQPLRFPQIRSRGFQNTGQHVVYVKPRRPTLRRMAAIVAVAYGCHLVYKNVVIGPLVNAYDELEKEMDEKTKKELEKAIEEDGTWFIPFPGTTKMVEPMPYKGSDPEWVEFVKFSKDHELAKKVRSDLAEHVRYICSKDPFLNHHLGKPMKIRRYWLDIDFPIKPPPTYERSGIEITDEYVAWTTMPVDSFNVKRMEQILWPKVFIQSSIAFIKVLFAQNLQRAGTLVGWETKPQPTYEALVALHKARGANGNGPGLPTLPTAQNSNPNTGRKQPEMINASTPTTNAPSQTDKNAAIKKSHPASPIGSDSFIKPSFDLLQEHMSAARTAFKHKWITGWRQPVGDPPRGSIVVSGMVEIEAARAWLVMDVKANWDPKTKEYDLRSTRFGMRRVQPKVQSPKGKKD